jgi:hypothetical protein
LRFCVLRLTQPLINTRTWSGPLGARTRAALPLKCIRYLGRRGGGARQPAKKQDTRAKRASALCEGAGSRNHLLAEGRREPKASALCTTLNPGAFMCSSTCSVQFTMFLIPVTAFLEGRICSRPPPSYKNNTTSKAHPYRSWSWPCHGFRGIGAPRHWS